MPAHCAPRAASADQIADHARDHRKHDWRPGDPPSFDQRYAVAALIGACEGFITSGMLGEDLESKLRQSIAVVEVAFSMPSKAELERA